MSDLLGDVLLARTRTGMPKVLVVTRGKTPTKATILAALDPFGVLGDDDDGWLNITRTGVADAPRSASWKRWCREDTEPLS